MDREVLITSGGTIARLDDVRFIGNFSAGTTGARIAEEFLRRGARVHYLHNRRADRPFRRLLAIDPARSLEEEISRIRPIYGELAEQADRLREYPFETFTEYYEAVQNLLTSHPIAVVILAAAASDYGTQPQAGKISSEQNELTFELTRNPKVIARVKQWRPHVFQVGFKLLAGVALEALVETAFLHGQQHHSDLTVANSIVAGDFQQRQYVIVSPDKTWTPVSSADLPARLVDMVCERLP